MNLEWIKEHPYATGGIVIIGGGALFLIVSSHQSSSGTSSSGNDTDAVLSADTQLQQISAASQAQQQQTQAQLQAMELQTQAAENQSQLQLESSNTQVAAQLVAAIVGGQQNVEETSIAANSNTTQQANQLNYAQNLQEMQDNVLEDQISSSTTEDLNANATSLASLEDQMNAAVTVTGQQAAIQSQALTDATQLGAIQANNQYNMTSSLIAGQNGNSIFNQSNAFNAAALSSDLAAVTGNSANSSSSIAVNNTAIDNSAAATLLSKIL
jgi:hypothetical protein